MKDRWIQTSETEDVAGSIRHAIRAAQFVAEDPLAWKWVVLALHSALQGACVCHLATTATPLGAVTKRNALEWHAYFENSVTDPKVKPPDIYLMALPDLLLAVRKPYSSGDRSNAAGIVITQTELRWLRRFHVDIRNQFVHFAPMGWSIDMSGIPEIAKLVARVIGKILSVGWAFRHQSLAKREEMQRSLQALGKIEWPVYVPVATETVVETD